MKPPKNTGTPPPETNSRGVPIADMSAILASVWNALAMDLKDMKDGHTDSIPTWPSVKGPIVANLHLKAKLADELLKGNGARLDRVVATKTPPLQNPWIRSGWILQNWVAFKRGGEPVGDFGMNMDFDDLGLCYLTDETAAAVIAHNFQMGDYSTKQFRDFRKKYNLMQVPLCYRMSGIVVRGSLKIDRKGRKRS